MTQTLQTLLALALVLLSLGYLLFRSLRKKRAGSCGCQSCPSKDKHP